MASVLFHQDAWAGGKLDLLTKGTPPCLQRQLFPVICCFATAHIPPLTLREQSCICLVSSWIPANQSKIETRPLRDVIININNTTINNTTISNTIINNTIITIHNTNLSHTTTNLTTRTNTETCPTTHPPVRRSSQGYTTTITCHLRHQCW